MEIIKRIIGVGSCQGIILDKAVRKIINANKGDYVRINVERMVKK